MGSMLETPNITVREGTTDRIIMQLLADDTAIDLTDVDHVVLELRDMRRNTYKYSSGDVSPKVGVSGATEGKVYLDPPSSLFKSVLSPYTLYWMVYEDATTWYGVPEEIEALIQVRRNY